MQLQQSSQNAIGAWIIIWAAEEDRDEWRRAAFLSQGKGQVWWCGLNGAGTRGALLFPLGTEKKNKQLTWMHVGVVSARGGFLDALKRFNNKLFNVQMSRGREHWLHKIWMSAGLKSEASVVSKAVRRFQNKVQLYGSLWENEPTYFSPQ